MKHPFNLENLFSFLSSQSIVLSNHQKQQFETYQKLLKIWSHKQNLVSSNDLSHLIERHFLSSALFLHYLPGTISGRIIDIGTGAGFPGVILKILRPRLSMTLLDSSHKKVLFLEEVCEQLDLDCPIIHKRSEGYIPQSFEKYQIVISRAVAKLELMWQLSSHLIDSEGYLYTIKGGNIHREIEELGNENLTVNVIIPDLEWLSVSNYLKDKYIVILEL